MDRRAFLRTATFSGLALGAAILKSSTVKNDGPLKHLFDALAEDMVTKGVDEQAIAPFKVRFLSLAEHIAYWEKTNAGHVEDSPLYFAPDGRLVVKYFIPPDTMEIPESWAEPGRRLRPPGKEWADRFRKVLKQYFPSFIRFEEIPSDDPRGLEKAYFKPIVSLRSMIEDPCRLGASIMSELGANRIGLDNIVIGEFRAPVSPTVGNLIIHEPVCKELAPRKELLEDIMAHEILHGLGLSHLIDPGYLELHYPHYVTILKHEAEARGQHWVPYYQSLSLMNAFRAPDDFPLQKLGVLDELALSKAIQHCVERCYVEPALNRTNPFTR